MNNSKLSTNESTPLKKISSRTTSEHNDLATNDTLNRISSKLVPHHYRRINESTSNERMFLLDRSFQNSPKISSLANSEISRLNTEREISCLIQNAHEKGKSLAKELWEKRSSVKGGLFENKNSERFMVNKMTLNRKFFTIFKRILHRCLDNF